MRGGRALVVRFVVEEGRLGEGVEFDTFLYV